MDNLVLNKLFSELEPRFHGAQFISAYAVTDGLIVEFDRGPLLFSLDNQIPLFIARRLKAVEAGPIHGFAGRLNNLLSEARLSDFYKPFDDRFLRLKFVSPNGREARLLYWAIPRRVSLNLYGHELELITSTGNPDSLLEFDGVNKEESVPLENGLLEELALADEEQVAIIQKQFSLGDELIKTIQTVYADSKIKATELIHDIYDNDFEISIYDYYSDRPFIAPVFYKLNAEKIDEDFESANDVAAKFLWKINRNKQVSDYQKDIRNTLKKRIKRSSSSLKKVKTDIRKMEDQKEAGKIGDLLLANVHLVKRGMESVKVVDYYHPEAIEMEIKLDPSLAPHENAEKYYNKAKKVKRGRAKLDDRVLELEKELEELNSLLLEFVENKDDLKYLEQKQKQFQNKGWMPKVTRKKKIINQTPGHHFTSSTGVEIIIGRNNKENETVTFTIGKENDFWMHAAGCPGSHVIIRNPSKRDTPDDITLNEAASLAAYFSKARNSSNVQVHWTKRRFVKKFKGAEPGKVILTGYKSVVVNPEIPKGVKGANS